MSYIQNLLYKICYLMLNNNINNISKIINIIIIIILCGKI